MPDGFGPTAFVKRQRRRVNRGGGGGGLNIPEFNPGRSTTESGSGSSSGSTTRKPIGVPEDYTSPFTRGGNYSARGAEVWAEAGRPHGSIGARPPMYWEGDEYAPGRLSPDAIADLQANLASAGLLTDRFRYGVFDEATRNAYAQLLGEANSAGVPFRELLAQRQQSITMGGDTGMGFDENGNPIMAPYQAPPLEIKTTNKDDLRRAFRTSIIDTIGEGWSQAQINEMVDAYNWQEIKVQKDAYDQITALERSEYEGTRDPAGGEMITEVSVPDPNTFLEQEMIRRDPQGYQAGRVVQDFVPAFMQMMQGWA